jgi:hypothetical protein
MVSPKLDFHELLRVLVRFDVEFIVVGGVAAVLRGAPVATFDLDIVHSRTSENVARLKSALTFLNAHYRGQGDRRLQPEDSHLRSSGHQLLMTELGPLDVLGSVGRGRDYNSLLPHSGEMVVGDIRFRVLGLPALIQVKEEVDQPKDRAVLDTLRATLEESEE